MEHFPFEKLSDECTAYLSSAKILCEHDAIPEFVFAYTISVQEGDERYKADGGKRYRFEVADIDSYEYKDVKLMYDTIPKKAFLTGVEECSGEGGIPWWVATAEKALCDRLYGDTMYFEVGATDSEAIRELLFDDWRLDEEWFKELDKEKLKEYASLYDSKVMNAFIEFLDSDVEPVAHYINGQRVYCGGAPI